MPGPWSVLFCGQSYVPTNTQRLRARILEYEIRRESRHEILPCGAHHRDYRISRLECNYLNKTAVLARRALHSHEKLLFVMLNIDFDGEPAIGERECVIEANDLHIIFRLDRVVAEDPRETAIDLAGRERWRPATLPSTNSWTSTRSSRPLISRFALR
jgi:hypothetical protein